MSGEATLQHQCVVCAVPSFRCRGVERSPARGERPCHPAQRSSRCLSPHAADKYLLVLRPGWPLRMVLGAVGSAGQMFDF